MSKRKQDAKADSGDESSSDVSHIDVDFDFFDLNPNVDYQAIKRLLIQLFHSDADTFDLHDLTELILSHPLGTTIKTDGADSDPYAVLTLLNMHTHHQRPAIKSLAAYLLSKSAQLQPKMHLTLQTLFSQSESQVGLIICERLVNMPVQAILPLYRMLLDELRNAISAGRSYKFSHLIFLSRTYHLSNDDESELAAQQSDSHNVKSKKPKKAKTTPPAQPRVGDEYDLLKRRPEDGIYPFHPEDLLIMQVAEYSMDYKFGKVSDVPREKDAFGIDTRGRVMLVKVEKFEELVKKMTEVYSVV